MFKRILAPALLAATLLFASCQPPRTCAAYKKAKYKPVFEQTFLTDKARK